jgi:uncharacterized damage-inducible protein DinB
MPLTLDSLRDFLRHMEWADASVWRAVLGHPAASSDSRVRDLLRHLHFVQRAFLAVWTGRPFQPPDADAAGWDRHAAHSDVRSYYSDLDAAVESFDAAALERPLVMPWVAPYEAQLGRRFEQPTLAETIFQVTSHSTYHRGQVNARLRELGGDPPNVDYIVWIWFGRPAADWPAS